MDFAAARFAENGYHPTSVAEIVPGLGVGKGVFYWYFDSKEELFLEILREAQTDLRRSQQQAIADEADPVRASSSASGRRWPGPRPTATSTSSSSSRPPRNASHGALRRGQDIAVADAVRHVKEAIAEGRIRDGDPEVLAHAILGVTSHLAAHASSTTAATPADEVADAAVAFCLDGLLAAP